jgi:Flp pilus assembly pilin Flp
MLKLLLLRNETGAALVEYGLLIGLIVVICIIAVTLLGGKISNALAVWLQHCRPPNSSYSVCLMPRAKGHQFEPEVFS